jgi:phospholipid transport system substrate-binding protein
LDWRLRNDKNKELKIIDIMVENVSMALTHRDEFSSVISQNGGKVEGLLKKLRSHIDEHSS